MKKLKYLALLSAFSLIGIFVGCSDSDVKKGENVGHASLELTQMVGGVNYCVEGDIVLNRTSPAAPAVTVTLATTCGDASHNPVLPAGTYTATLTNYDCEIIPVDDPDLDSCTQTSVPSFVVVVGQTTNVQIPVQFDFEEADDVEVVFGVGAANVTIAPTESSEDVCGGDGVGGAPAEVCGVNQVCLNLDATVPHCYTRCDFVEGLPLADGCAIGDCWPVAAAQGAGGAGGEGGAWPVQIGDDTDLDNVPGVCVGNTVNPVGGSGGTGAGGTAGSGGSAGSAVAGTGGTTAGTGGTVQ